MAKLSDLIVRTSEVTGIPEGTVREISRRLREGGLIGTGKGGRYGGAEMTPSDVAGLLTALLVVRASSVSLSDIVPLTKSHLRDLTSHSPRGHRMVLDRWNPRLALPELCQLNRGHTFEEAFTGLIASFSSGTFKHAMAKWDRVDLLVEIFSPRSIVSATPEPEAKIKFETGAFGHLYLHYIRHRIAERTEVVVPKTWSDIPKDDPFGLTVAARLGDTVLKSMGLLLRPTETKHA
ncbi:MAG: hypothetical protein P4L80_01090 [Xanthobacteraceae bacterium]|nr:hypothetical protein [Xanthobacteraceae bacterium]